MYGSAPIKPTFKSLNAPAQPAHIAETSLPQTGSAIRPPDIGLESPPQTQTMSFAQREQVQEWMSDFSQQPGVIAVMLADLSGQPLASWSRWESAAWRSKMEHIAVLAAGGIAATRALSSALQETSRVQTMIQDYGNMRLLLGPVERDMVLLLATNMDIPTGWSRLAFQRLGSNIASLEG